MNKLEAQAIIEATGDYDEEQEEVSAVLEAYEELCKHIGFKDKRKDKRFIVKFHDIFYYMPDGVEEAEVDGLFEMFCRSMINMVDETLDEEGVNTGILFSDRFVGHYQAFLVDIPELTEENAVEYAMKTYDELVYYAKYYVDYYFKAVNTLQDLEDNYMTYWIEFLREGKYMTEEQIKEIEEKYNHDKLKNNKKGE